MMAWRDQVARVTRRPEGMTLKQQMLVNIAAMRCSRPPKEAKIIGALPAVTLCAWMLITTSSTRRPKAAR